MRNQIQPERIKGDRVRYLNQINQAGLFDKNGNPINQAGLFDKNGNQINQAGLFDKNGNAINQAGLFDKNGNAINQAGLFDKNGNQINQAGLFDKNGNQINQAGLFDKNGNAINQAGLFDKNGNAINQAGLFDKNGNPINQAGLFDKNGNQINQAGLFDKNGNPINQAGLFDKNGNPINQAGLFDKNGNPINQAGLFDKNGNQINQAGLFDKNGNAINQADLFDKNGNQINQAGLFDKNGNQINQAGLFDKNGNASSYSLISKVSSRTKQFQEKTVYDRQGNIVGVKKVAYAKIKKTQFNTENEMNNIQTQQLTNSDAKNQIIDDNTYTEFLIIENIQESYQKIPNMQIIYKQSQLNNRVEPLLQIPALFTQKFTKQLVQKPIPNTVYRPEELRNCIENTNMQRGRNYVKNKFIFMKEYSIETVMSQNYQDQMQQNQIIKTRNQIIPQQVKIQIMQTCSSGIPNNNTMFNQKQNVKRINALDIPIQEQTLQYTIPREVFRQLYIQDIDWIYKNIPNIEINIPISSLIINKCDSNSNIIDNSLFTAETQEMISQVQEVQLALIIKPGKQEAKSICELQNQIDLCENTTPVLLVENMQSNFVKNTNTQLTSKNQYLKQYAVPIRGQRIYSKPVEVPLQLLSISDQLNITPMLSQPIDGVILFREERNNKLSINQIERENGKILLQFAENSNQQINQFATPIQILQMVNEPQFTTLQYNSLINISIQAQKQDQVFQQFPSFELRLFINPYYPIDDHSVNVVLNGESQFNLNKQKINILYLTEQKENVQMCLSQKQIMERLEQIVGENNSGVKVNEGAMQKKQQIKLKQEVIDQGIIGDINNAFLKQHVQCGVIDTNSAKQLSQIVQQTKITTMQLTQQQMHQNEQIIVKQTQIFEWQPFQQKGKYQTEIEQPDQTNIYVQLLEAQSILIYVDSFRPNQISKLVDDEQFTTCGTDLINKENIELIKAKLQQIKNWPDEEHNAIQLQIQNEYEEQILIINTKKDCNQSLELQSVKFNDFTRIQTAQNILNCCGQFQQYEKIEAQLQNSGISICNNLQETTNIINTDQETQIQFQLLQQQQQQQQQENNKNQLQLLSIQIISLLKEPLDQEFLPTQTTVIDKSHIKQIQVQNIIQNDWKTEEISITSQLLQQEYDISINMKQQSEQQYIQDTIILLLQTISQQNNTINEQLPNSQEIQQNKQISEIDNTPIEKILINIEETEQPTTIIQLCIDIQDQFLIPLEQTTLNVEEVTKELKIIEPNYQSNAVVLEFQQSQTTDIEIDNIHAIDQEPCIIETDDHEPVDKANIEIETQFNINFNLLSDQISQVNQDQQTSAYLQSELKQCPAIVVSLPKTEQVLPTLKQVNIDQFAKDALQKQLVQLMNQLTVSLEQKEGKPTMYKLARYDETVKQMLDPVTLELFSIQNAPQDTTDLIQFVQSESELIQQGADQLLEHQQSFQNPMNYLILQIIQAEQKFREIVQKATYNELILLLQFTFQQSRECFQLKLLDLDIIRSSLERSINELLELSIEKQNLLIQKYNEFQELGTMTAVNKCEQIQKWIAQEDEFQTEVVQITEYLKVFEVYDEYMARPDYQF
ncbi:Conserved_hypothetical protein [Hexamita inflata]|uniref:Uncharacterized protein n=1 Tax=Hexamita inflata TaxID=28002 RepID=A0AA86QKM2_9EUKA|nr:Conserved hypothetical protein [Hexamita inflata]